LRRAKVVKIQFLKKEDQSWFLDPKEGFSKKFVSFEIRRDDLTGHVSRILPYRRKYPEVVIPRNCWRLPRKSALSALIKSHLLLQNSCLKSLPRGEFAEEVHGCFQTHFLMLDTIG